MSDPAEPKDELEPESVMDMGDAVNEAEEQLVVNQPYDVPLDVLLNEEANPLTPEDVKKLKQIGLGVLGVVLLVIVMFVYGMQPKKAPMAYGICATFLELNTPYPQTLSHIDLEGSRTAIRIYFTSVDPFGQFKQEMLECKFGPDEQMGMKLTEVLRNRRPMDAKIINDFNATLPAIMAGNPNLQMPGPDWKNPLLPR